MARKGSSLMGLARLQRRLDQIPREVKAQVQKQMEQEAAAIVTAMKGAVPVDTGALRNSIGWKWGRLGKGQTAIAQAKAALGSGMVLTIYAGNEATLKPGEDNRYQQQLAKMIEFGTQHMQKRPFFYGTWRMMRKRAQSNVRKSVSRAVKAATK